MVLLKAKFDDGSFIIGERTSMCKMRESKGTHHLIVVHATEPTLIGCEVAIPIEKPKYWVMLKANK